MSRRLSAEERQALSELNRILSETPQWSGEEELCIEMENIGGRVCFCHFWNEHYSMVQLTENRNGKYSTAYVLDAETTPDVRKAAALQAQKEPDHTALVLEEFGKLAGDVQAVVAQLQQVTAQLTALREAVDAIEMPKYVEAAPSVEAASTAVTADVQKRVPEDEQPEVVTNVENTTETDVPESQIPGGIENDTADEAELELADDSLTQTDYTPAEVEAASTEEPEAVAEEAAPTEEPETVAEEAAPTEEPEPAFNTEDFFSQFGGSADKELKEEAEFKEEAANTGMLDQSMIDALLGNLQADKPAEDVKNADVIPFPQQGQTDLSTEEAHAEEVAEAVHEVEQDITDTTMNMDAEPAPTMPVDDNPNRTLSPEEIAALFASMQ